MWRKKPHLSLAIESMPGAHRAIVLTYYAEIRAYYSLTWCSTIITDGAPLVKGIFDIFASVIWPVFWGVWNMAFDFCVLVAFEKRKGVRMRKKQKNLEPCMLYFEIYRFKIGK